MNVENACFRMIAMQAGGKATVWFGAYQNQVNKVWYFLDGTPMMMNSTGGWQKNCPNATAPAPQRCLGFSVGGTDSGWRDFPCSSNFSFGCYMSDPTQKGVY